MQMNFWSENPDNNGAIKDLKKLCNKKEIEWYLDKLKSFEKYLVKDLFKAEIIKRIQNWHLHEIRIKNIRFIGDIFDGIFQIFTVEKKEKRKLPESAFAKANNIKVKFIEQQNEH